MKTIKQAAIDNTVAFGFPQNTEFTGQVKQVYNSLVQCFQDGAEWAQRWISFNKEMPRQADYILVRNPANIRLVLFDGKNPANRKIDENNFAIDGVCYMDWRPIDRI